MSDGPTGRRGGENTHVGTPLVGVRLPFIDASLWLMDHVGGASARPY